MDCASCGTANRGGARFCDACGAPLAAPAAAATVARKVVTIAFADLVGSTALHERLDAESARAVMDRYYAALEGAVAAHGGTVVKRLGDGVMAAFGVPRVAEDDALRAVRAATAIVAAVGRLAAEPGRGRSATPGSADTDGLSVRVAVNTGEVVVSADQTDVVGDPVNVAARLQQEAGAGEVLLGEATRRLVAGLVTLAPVGALALRGRAESVAAHRLVSLERPVGAAAAPFVGRDDELRRLLAVFAEATRARGARLAVVLGSPGLGKSRLLSELAGRLGDGATVLAARCDAAGGATFAPLAEALRAHFGLDESAAADRVRAALDAALGEDGDRARIAAGVAALLAGAPAPPEETFFVVRRLLAALAARRPVLLTVDDLQWAEPLLLDLVEHLVQWTTDAPVLVLAAARPELRATRAALTQPGALVREAMTLAGLDAGAATRLAANVVGADALPAAIAGRVLATSEGNPLFVGELVRMLVQDGALRRDGDRWTAGVEPAALEMPPTIHALLAARIERLGAEERAVLERAAVVGRSFSRAALAALLPHELAGELDARLQVLQRGELIEPDPAWYLGEPALRFHHVLIRDAAYRRLLKGTRAELHERLADWIARPGGAGEHEETIGWHLEQAHQHLAELGALDGAGRALGARAARALAAAGRRALARDDLRLAGNLLGRAVARVDAADPGRAELVLDWCEALLAAGDVAAGAAAVAELGRCVGVEGAAPSAPDVRRDADPMRPAPMEGRAPRDAARLRAWHTCFAGQLAALTDSQALRATVDAVADAARTLAAAGDAAGEAKACAVHATALARLGAIGACEAALDQALAAARRAGDRRRANGVLAGAPLAALWGPSPVTRASGRCLDVVRVLRITQGAPAVEAVALRCQAVLEALRGRGDAARRMIASSRRLVEELGITHRLLEADVFAGLIELLEGDAAAAERCLRPAYEGLRAQGLGIDAARAAALLARALLAQERRDEAEALTHESEVLAGDDLQAAIAWRGVRAEALARRGQPDAAVDLARAAVEIAAATDALLDHADARWALAIALRAAGRAAEAGAEENRAIELWDAKHATVLSARARVATGRPAPPSAPPPRADPPPMRGRVRPNAATDHVARLDAAAAAGDLDGFLALLAEDATGVHHPTETTYLERDQVRGYAVLFGAEQLTFRHQVLATVGERLALCRGEVSFQSVDAFASVGVAPFGAANMDSYVLAEVDRDGRRTHSEFFALDRLGDAVARLYERHATSLAGAARERAAATARSVANCMRGFDLDATAAILAPDVAFVDHRRLGYPSGRGAAQVLRALRSLLELAEGVDRRVEDVLGLGADALLARLTVIGTDRAGGGAFEYRFCQLWTFGPDGRVTRLEWFDATAAEDALARVEALAAQPAGPLPIGRRIANAATRSMARFQAAWETRDWAAIEALFAPEFRHGDRRPLIRLELDRDQFLAALGRTMAIESARLPQLGEPLATRGERLALARAGFFMSHGDVGPSELDWLMVLEVNARGERVAMVTLDADDLDAAHAELDARFTAGEAAPFPHIVEAMERFRNAFAGRDWEALAAVLAPDLAMHDHRPLGWEPTRGSGPYIDALRTLVDLAPDVRLRLDHASVCARGYLALSTWVGTHEGGVFESPSWIVGELDASARACRFDQYDLDQLDAALAAYAALRAAADADPLRVPPNAATRAMDRWVERAEAGDRAAVQALFAPEAVLEDRRRLARLRGGRDLAVASSRLLARRDASVSRTLLATGGDRLALERVAWARSAGAPAVELDILQVVEVDAQGRIVAALAFDADDRSAASDEIFERFARSEAARLFPPAIVGLVRAMRAHDLDAIRGALPDDFYVEDHRRTGLGRLEGAEAYVASLAALFAMSPDLRFETLYEVASDARGHLAVARMVGTLASGGAFETLLVRLTVFRDDRYVGLEVFEIEDLDRARARFAALG